MPFTGFEPPPPPPCRHPGHNPPNLMRLKPGTHTWTCEACGQSVTFTVPLVTC